MNMYSMLSMSLSQFEPVGPLGGENGFIALLVCVCLTLQVCSTALGKGVQLMDVKDDQYSP